MLWKSLQQQRNRQPHEASSTISYNLPNMRATIVSLLCAAGLSLAQEYPVTVVVELATKTTCAPFKNSTITFDQSTPHYNTNGDLDRVVGLYIGSENDSLCVPYNADGSQTIDADDGYFFDLGDSIHVSPPVKDDYIQCGLE
ncbi:hypothetical protein GGR57DRAFT_520575 [Xylariaceae sp. FL1272]|nr:hypothetical protein GGR57DRAFT_520575 [Xylariaceae sp. FL1272]